MDHGTESLDQAGTALVRYGRKKNSGARRLDAFLGRHVLLVRREQRGRNGRKAPVAQRRENVFLHRPV